MLYVSERTAGQAWRTALRRVFDAPESDHPKHARDAAACIEVRSPSSAEGDPLFPMPPDVLDAVNRFMATGTGEAAVGHAWTRLYQHRLFDGEPSVYEVLLAQLAARGSRSVATIWRQEDVHAGIAPCALTFSACIRDERLDMVVHARATDAYGKLLMNLTEFIAVQELAADALRLPLGSFLYIADSFHVYRADLERAEALLHRLAE